MSSHGQRLAINATTSAPPPQPNTININTNRGGVGEFLGNPLSLGWPTVGCNAPNNLNNNAGGGAGGKVALKIQNPTPNNSELRYATVTIAAPPTVSGGQVTGGIRSSSFSHGIQHGANAAMSAGAGAGAAGHLIHLIPLQIGNINNVGTVAGGNAQKIHQPLPTDSIPLNIIKKNNNNYRANAQPSTTTTTMIGNIDETAEIAKIIGTTTMAMKEAGAGAFTNTISVAGGGVGVGVSRALVAASTSATNNVSTGAGAAAMNAMNPLHSSNNAALNGSPTIFLQNQLQKVGAAAAATLQCVPIATGGVASIISTNSQFSVNGNIQRTTMGGRLSSEASSVLQPPPPPTSTITNSTIIRETKIIEQVQRVSIEELSNHHILSAAALPPLPSSSKSIDSNVIYDHQPKPIPFSIAAPPIVVPNSMATAVAKIHPGPSTSTDNNQKPEECILPDNNDLKTPPNDYRNQKNVEKFKSNLPAPTKAANVIDHGLETMLIIDDSSDEEDFNNRKDEIASEKLPEMDFRHITNSVVLTKAKAIDVRCNGGSSRNLSPEPASVVLMKLPNVAAAAAGGGGATKSNVEIPIVEAFSLAAAENKKAPPNVIKIISAPKIITAAPKTTSHSPTMYMRSNSVPSPTKNLSPRSTKRCQSMYSSNQQAGGVAKMSPNPQQQQKQQSNALESPAERRRNSNNLNSVITYPSSSHSQSKPIDLDNDKIVDEPMKATGDTNDVTFIDLDDSLADVISVDSDINKNELKTPEEDETTPIEEEGMKKDAEKEKPISTDESSSKKVDITQPMEDVDMEDTNDKKDQNANTKIVDSHSQTSSSSNHQNVSSTSQTSPTAAKNAVKSNLEKNENQDQKLRTLLCNEKITPHTSSSSTSSSSTKDTSSPAALSTSARKTLIPTSSNHQRDHHQNKLVDSNAATTRRLCRDSSIASALSMVSTFDMLNWKEDRIASARGTSMRFELNEFNILQLHERGCPPRYRIHTPYEQPIYERFRSMPKSDQADPLLYLCRTCKLYGPAVDFLAPEFCSVECLKRKVVKRSSRDAMQDAVEKKRARKMAHNSSSSGGGGSGTNKPSIQQPKPLPTFRWNTYLSTMRNAIAAPIDLFLNPFPTGPNPFTVGMKVEAIDPENCSLFCVCTIVQIQGYRLRLNFDGYNSVYDFWVNADSMDIFPPGWCAKTNRILQPPRGYEPHKFEWSSYLKKTNSVGADKKFFTHLNSASIANNRNPFTVGMFLEADDLNDTGKLCVASVADVLDERIRVHFDGWDDCYDYWVDISSPYIHPCGWHEGRQQLLVPPEYSNSSFNWRDYIRDSQGLAAPTDFFVSRDAIDYRPGMKLEVVDPRNPCLIRPATVANRSRHRVKVHFDCWPPEYIFCLEDDSPDLHPIGWCDATGHDLEPPPGFLQPAKIMPCSTVGCRGLGNMDRSNGLTHANSEFCPYVLENWRSKVEKIPRVDGKEIIRKLSPDTTTLTSSILKNLKLPLDQSNNKNSLEILKAAEKLLNIPYKQPGRGRPRNCDRLAAAAAALQRQQLLQQQLQENIQNDSTISPPETAAATAAASTIKTENDGGRDGDEEMGSNSKKHVKKQARKSQSASASAATSPTPKASTAAAAAAATTTAPHTFSADSDATKLTVAKRFLADYGPRLQQNYVLWRENAAAIDIASKVQRNPLLWTTAETCAFIDAILSECNANANANSSRYAVSSKFYKHDIDGAALLMLQQHDLTDMLELKLGPAIKLCEIILQLRMIVVSKYNNNNTSTSTTNKLGGGSNGGDDDQVNSMKNWAELSK